jgi:hypothetical protein
MPSAGLNTCALSARVPELGAELLRCLPCSIKQRLHPEAVRLSCRFYCRNSAAFFSGAHRVLPVSRRHIVLWGRFSVSRTQVGFDVFVHFARWWPFCFTAGRNLRLLSSLWLESARGRGSTPCVTWLAVSTVVTAPSHCAEDWIDTLFGCRFPRPRMLLLRATCCSSPACPRRAHRRLLVCPVSVWLGLAQEFALFRASAAPAPPSWRAGRRHEPRRAARYAFWAIRPSRPARSSS